MGAVPDQLRSKPFYVEQVTSCYMASGIGVELCSSDVAALSHGAELKPWGFKGIWPATDRIDSPQHGAQMDRLTLCFELAHDRSAALFKLIGNPMLK